MKYLKTYEQVNLSQKELNDILDKVGNTGIDSLSNHEKNLLDNFDTPNFDKDDEIAKFQNKYLASKSVVKNIGLAIENHPLEKDIGRYIKFKPGSGQGFVHKLIHEIVGIQKHWGHNEEGIYAFDRIGYRVAEIGNDNSFGRVCGVNEAIFVNMTEDEAINYNKKMMGEFNY